MIFCLVSRPERRVGAEIAVAVQLHEAVADPLQVVEGVGAPGVAGQLGALPVGDGREHLGLELVDLLAQPLALLGLAGIHLQGSDLGLEVEDGPLEVGKISGLSAQEHLG